LYSGRGFKGKNVDFWRTPHSGEKNPGKFNGKGEVGFHKKVLMNHVAKEKAYCQGKKRFEAWNVI